MHTRQNVGILGATGMVGQRFIQLLENHPWFRVSWLAASDRSSGKRYADAVRWKLDTPIPSSVAALPVSPATPTGAPTIVFAALDSDIAREMEPTFAAAGCAVISNSSAFRMDPNVPLVIPEVNPEHLALLSRQNWNGSTQNKGGSIVTNPNCSAIGLVLALKPLAVRFGLRSVLVSTMQAVSGAGYPGVPSLDILGNVIPFIRNEEEKLEAETLRLLGTLTGDHVVPLDAKISAHCNRVAVEDGHTESVSVELVTAAGREEILGAWRDFQPLRDADLPTAPLYPIEYDPADDRPQPRLDRMRGRGMTVTVGRLRPCSLLHWKFTVLSHNTIRGAAGAALLNAELLASQGKLPSPRTPG
jgi:aspartate-semialdehyde dehydrogenase